MAKSNICSGYWFENAQASSPNGTATVYSNLKDGIEIGGTTVGLNAGGGLFSE